MLVLLRWFAMFLAAIAVWLEAVTAFDITTGFFPQLKVDETIVGVHESEFQRVNPPSTIVSSWYLRMQKGKASKGDAIGHGCPDDSTLCGVIKVASEADAIQMLSLTETDALFKYDEKTGLVAEWKGVSYGDLTLCVQLDFTCVDTSEDAIEWANHTTSFIDGDVHLVWKNREFCSKSGGNNDGGDKGNKGSDGGDKGDNNAKDSGLGLFGMLFLIGAVSFAGYLVAQAWFNTSTMGSSSDFFNELVDIVVESLSSIPRLVLEVVNKITGGGGNASRGGYSAV